MNIMIRKLTWSRVAPVPEESSSNVEILGSSRSWSGEEIWTVRWDPKVLDRSGEAQKRASMKVMITREIVESCHRDGFERHSRRSHLIKKDFWNSDVIGLRPVEKEFGLWFMVVELSKWVYACVYILDDDKVARAYITKVGF